MVLLLIGRALYETVSCPPLTPWNGPSWTVGLFLVHHYLYGTVTRTPLSSRNCLYSVFNSMKVASPSLTIWKILFLTDKLIVAQIDEKFPVLYGIWRFTAAVQVYWAYQQSLCTWQPFTSFRPLTLWHLTTYIYIYTGHFTTLGHNCRRWFPRSLWSKKFI